MRNDHDYHRIIFGAVILIGLTASAHSEPICDIDDRMAELDDGERLIIRGRIDESYGIDSNGAYTYNIVDSCGEADVGSYEPIECAGEITIAGEFDINASIDLWGQIAIWVNEAICE